MAEDSPSLPAAPSAGNPPPDAADWIGDGALLRRYADRQDEAAFAELVRRHVDLVYAAALRKVGGDAHSAGDVTQRVFTDLARKAASLARHPALAGWLFTATHYAATQLVRAERRRRAHEQTAHTMNELAHDPAAAIDGERLRPLLDDVVLELDECDREAVLLRFFEGRGFAELGARLQLSEDGARSRVERALEKMQGLFARRGITSTSAALALALGSQAAGATAPAALAASVTTTALAGATGSGTIASWLATLTLMSTTKFTGGAFVLALALAASVAVNGYLLLHSSPEPQAATAALPAATPTRATVPRVAPLKLDEDATALRDRLRAAGMDESTVRGVVEGILRRRYRDQLALVRDEQIKHA
jgi:RNA polymerase sigma factor (sigma-70 family)